MSYKDRIIRVGLILDDKLTLKNSSYSPYNLSGNNLSYEDIFLNGRDSKIITVIFETEVNSNIGDIIRLTSNVELKNNIDIYSSNNAYNLIDTIRCYFDQNYKSINFYFKNGFVIERVADFDIGNNFVMNDFVMIWKRPS